LGIGIGFNLVSFSHSVPIHPRAVFLLDFAGVHVFGWQHYLFAFVLPVLAGCPHAQF
jgi:Na+/H+ antiporter NhaC